MKNSFFKKALAALLSLTVMTGTIAGMSTATAAPAVQESAISAEEFASPGMGYRPGTRWWISLGSTKEQLVDQVNYLADNGFGMVEFVVFNSGYITGGANGPMAATSADNTLYPDPNLYDYETDTFYERLEAVLAASEARGITVDLNMGTGYEANSIFVTAEDAQEQMALGRTTLTINEGDINAVQQFTIPDAEISPLYTTYANGVPRALWTGVKDINAIIISKIVSKEGTALKSGNQFVDLENKTITKEYSNQYVLDPENTITIDLNGQDVKAGDTIQWTPPAEGEWEVAVLYSVPSGSTPIRGFYSEDKVSLVTDHMDGKAVERYINDYFGPNNARMNKLVTKYKDTIRAAFNDSYEFYVDQYYNYKTYEMAKDAQNNPAGYDFSMYLPSLYKLSESCFGIGGVSADWVKYGKTTDTFLTYDLTDDEKNRIKYDYQTVVNELFMEGQAAFSDTLEQYDMVYRQQAYNPPIDTLRSAKNVDIPETEGLSEYSLKRVASGAHLYGRNLVTSEVYTLGSTPYNCTPSFIKNGYDLMATSGVNNFLYHGLSSTYFGTEEAQANNAYGEYGWRGWPTIGIDITQNNPLWPYFNSLNAYASRLNYIMQAGRHSADVAMYMPLFGSLNETDAVKTMNYNGYTWDAINDDSIQNEASVQDGKIVLKSGLTFDALVLQNAPVTTSATLDSLRALAEQGASIVFYGDLPGKQGSYANGNYAEKDAEIAQKAAALLADFENVYQVKSMDEYAALLETVVSAPVSYEYNENVRFDRRALSTGGEVAYIRNLSSSAPTTVTLTVDQELQNCYYLDQNDGSIYNAKKGADGTITFTLQPGNAIGVLCEPDGVAMDMDDVSAGIPDSIDTAEAAETVELSGFTLTVTADNIGSCQKGEKQTVTYTENVLGNWIKDDFQGGALKYVSDVGVYETTFEIEDLSYYLNKKLELDLGEAYTAATVYVNDVNLGQVMFKPYTVDVTPALVEGTNTLRIELQPLAYNRRGGFSQAYRETGEQQYAYYNEYIGTVRTWSNTGIEGPITLNTYVPEDAVKSVSAPESAQVNASFDVTVVTAAAVTDVRLFNEYDMAIGRKNVDVAENEDGTKTWTITVAIGTVGNGRTLKVVTKGSESYLVNSGKTVSIDITSVPPVLNSFDLPDSAVANRTFIVKATTDMAATKIAVYNENGMKMGLKSLSYKIVDGQKEWTAVMSIGTKGERTFTAYAVNKFGAQSEALTDNISVKAFA
ncbi:MAG: hypothetical protein HFE85_00800 [Clostridiales bacterium]|nr:hypothetical protein [Clostridiales bacterium]